MGMVYLGILKDGKGVFGYTQFRKMGNIHDWRQVTVVHIHHVFHLEKQKVYLDIYFERW